MLALDSKQGVIAVFGETEYGRLINEAVGLRYDGDETQAVALWQEVLRMDENNELANTGIGKAYLSAGDNEKAMEYLKRGMNRDYYSVAFKRYRNDVLKSNINYILTGIIAVIVAIVVVVKVIRPRRNQKNGRRA
jgi:tetratricopeptide (TPR) repeat protein